MGLNAQSHYILIGSREKGAQDSSCKKKRAVQQKEGGARGGEGRFKKLRREPPHGKHACWGGIRNMEGRQCATTGHAFGKSG